MNRKDTYIAGLVFFIAYCAYLLAAYPTITTEDSGEFTAAIETLGIAHPSGYPLYIIVGRIFSLLVPFGNAGWKANIFSAATAAAAVTLIFIVVRFITSQRASAFITAIFFASGELFWSQAIRAEVYGLNSFFLILCIFLSFVYGQKIQEKKIIEANRILKWLAFIFGLSLANHQLMIMAALPLFFYIVWVRPKAFLDMRLIGKTILLFLLGISIYLYLPIRASYNPAVNWGNPTNERFWEHVTRAFYSADAVDSSMNLIKSSTVSSASSSAANPIGDFFVHHVSGFSIQFWQILNENYTILSVIFIFAGALWLIKKNPKFGAFLLLLGLFYSFILSAVLGLGNMDKLPMRLFIDRPFYIPLLIITAVVMGLGLAFILEKLANSKINQTVQKGAAALTVILVLSALVLRFPAMDQHDNYIAYDIAKGALLNLPTNAVLLSENYDNTLFPLLYLKTVERLRPDVKIYIPSPINIFSYYQDYDHMAAENPDKPYFTDFPFAFYADKTYLFGGTFSQIVPLTKALSSEAKLIQPEEIRGINKSNLDHFNKYMVSRFYLDLGLAMTNETEQEKFFQKAWEVGSESRNIVGQLVGNYDVLHEKYAQALPYLTEAHRLMPDEYPISFQYAVALLMEGKKEAAKDLLESLQKEQKQLLTKELASLKANFPDKFGKIELP